MTPVMWDKGSGLFYDTDKDGPLDTREAFSRIHYNPEANRFTDDYGRFVPNWVSRSPASRERLLSSHDEEGNAVLSTRLVTEVVDRQSPRLRDVAANQNVRVRVVYRLPDGTVHEVYVSAGLGREPDIDELERLAQKKADADFRAALKRGYLANTEQALKEIEPYVISIDWEIVTIKGI